MIIDVCPPSSACRRVLSSVPYGLQSAKDTVDSRANEAGIPSLCFSTVCSPTSSRQLKRGIPNTESIRDFAKGVGMLVAVRHAPSPLWETVASFRVLLHHGRDTLHAPWARRARRVLPGTDLSPLLAAM